MREPVVPAREAEAPFRLSMRAANGTEAEAMAHAMPASPVPEDGPLTRLGDAMQRGLDRLRGVAGLKEHVLVDTAEHVVNGRWGEAGKGVVQTGKALTKEGLRDLKILATGVAAANAVGAAGFAGFHGALQEVRLSPAVTPETARTELAKLMKDPDGYLQKNYTNTVAGVPIGPEHFNFDSHLKQLPGEGATYRRVPADLYDALQAAQGGKGTVRARDAVGEAEIRPPFRREALRDGVLRVQVAPGSTPVSFRVKAEAALGPADGWQARAGGEVAVNDPAKTDALPITTVRVAKPSATGQVWGVGVRQQETTVASKLGVNANAIDLNHAQVTDLTEPSSLLSGREVQVLGGSAYLSSGERDRLRVDATQTGAFARAQRTNFIEAGVGVDYVRVKQGDRFAAVTAYSEVQAYPNVFRADVKPGAGGAPSLKVQGPSTLPLPLELDTAPVQVTTNMAPRILAPFDLFQQPTGKAMRLNEAALPRG